jgi:hypothetical protein
VSAEIDQLFKELEKFDFKGEAATFLFDHQECKPRIFSGTAFFPGGEGLWKENVSNINSIFPKGKIMVLGHDFGSVKGYKISTKHKNGENLETQTWQNLQEWFKQYLNDIFFTNAYMGIRRKGAVGKINRGYNFNKQCFDFLKKQIEIQTPKVIFTLGIEPLKALDKTFDLYYGKGFLKRKGEIDFSYIDRERNLAIQEIQLLNGYTPMIVALTHPYLFDKNVQKRGEDYHKELINKGLHHFKTNN